MFDNKKDVKEFETQHKGLVLITRSSVAHMGDGSTWAYSYKNDRVWSALRTSSVD